MYKEELHYTDRFILRLIVFLWEHKKSLKKILKYICFLSLLYDYQSSYPSSLTSEEDKHFSIKEKKKKKDRKIQCWVLRKRFCDFI